MFQLKKYIRVSFVALKIDAKVEEKLTSAFKGFDMRNLAKKKNDMRNLANFHRLKNSDFF